MICGMTVDILPQFITNVGISVLAKLVSVIVATPHSAGNSPPPVTAVMTPPAHGEVTTPHAPEVRSRTSQSRVTEDVMQTTEPARIWIITNPATPALSKSIVCH